MRTRTVQHEAVVGWQFFLFDFLAVARFLSAHKDVEIYDGEERRLIQSNVVYTFNIVMKFRSYAIETAHNLKIILKSILIFIATKCRALWIKWTIASNAVYCSIILSLLCVRECKENFERDTPWHTFELQKKLIYQCAGRTIAHVIDPYLYEYMCRAQIFSCTHL